MIDPLLVSLSDVEMDRLLQAAQTIAPDRRPAFLQDVADELAKHPEPGPGVTHRAIAAAQKKHFDAPTFTAGGFHRGPRS
jgi:hypothetical protein